MSGNWATGIWVMAISPASVMTTEMTIESRGSVDEDIGDHGAAPSAASGAGAALTTCRAAPSGCPRDDQLALLQPLVTTMSPLGLTGLDPTHLGLVVGIDDHDVDALAGRPAGPTGDQDRLVVPPTEAGHRHTGDRPGPRPGSGYPRAGDRVGPGIGGDVDEIQTPRHARRGCRPAERTRTSRRRIAALVLDRVARGKSSRWVTGNWT
jgi:hypothetical protein